ncbi:MAG: HIT family protein [Chitinophagales bacterium]|nr:HIT family protein [Chitinophagales bacterium]
MSNCIFCRIINGEIPASTVYEDEKVIAFMDIAPINSGHVLVIPKQHVQDVFTLDESLGGHLYQVAVRISKALKHTDLKCEGINLLQNNGVAAFQEVMHVHLHIIPRYRGDGMRVKWGAKAARRSELEAAAEAIKQQLNHEP